MAALSQRGWMRTEPTSGAGSRTRQPGASPEASAMMSASSEVSQGKDAVAIKACSGRHWPSNLPAAFAETPMACTAFWTPAGSASGFWAYSALPTIPLIRFERSWMTRPQMAPAISSGESGVVGAWFAFGGDGRCEVMGAWLYRQAVEFRDDGLEVAGLNAGVVAPGEEGEAVAVFPDEAVDE